VGSPQEPGSPAPRRSAGIRHFSVTSAAGYRNRRWNARVDDRCLHLAKWSPRLAASIARRLLATFSRDIAYSGSPTASRASARTSKVRHQTHFPRRHRTMIHVAWSVGAALPEPWPRRRMVANVRSPRSRTSPTSMFDVFPDYSTAHVFRPFSPTGRSRLRTKTRRGDCFTGSLATVRRDAWRCSMGNRIVDPCFSSRRAPDAVLCPRAAWKRTGIRIKLRQPLPRPRGKRPSIKLRPWALELVDGRHCGMETGATEAIGGTRANFDCDAGNDWLWGFPDRSTEPWTIFIAPYGATELSGRAPINRAWM
jgi:hypothetical protein